MSIRGAGLSVINLLERKYLERFGDEDLQFDMISTSRFAAEPANSVTLFLYRVDVHPTRRHQARPGADPRTSDRLALNLDLRYLLTVWGTDAQREQQVLERVMVILEENSIIPGELLDQSDPWEPEEALQVTLDSLSNEDVLRLWDSIAADFRLSIAYCVRTVRVGSIPRDPMAARPVDARINTLGPKGGA